MNVKLTSVALLLAVGSVGIFSGCEEKKKTPDVPASTQVPPNTTDAK